MAIANQRRVSRWRWLPTALLLLAAMPSIQALFFAPPEEFLEQVMEKAGREYCSPSGRISETCCDYETVESMTDKLAPTLYELTHTPYFKYAKMDLKKECAFWPNDDVCGQRDCAVQTTDESDIPEKWRSSFLGAVDYTSVKSPLFKKCSVSDKDFCVLEDATNSDGVYVDLTKNPERFTGYAGDGAWRVWRAIYKENCFGLVQETGVTRGPFAAIPRSSEQLPNLLRSLASDQDSGADEVCKEKRIFYRILSGLHASISIHICDEYFDQETGRWEHNLDCFITRIGHHPERLQNVYFNYVLLLRAVTKMSPYLQNYRFCSGDDAENAKVKRMVDRIVSTTLSCPSTFDETTMFSDATARVLKDEFKHHFRNITRIMDCVGCEKCRLWGKVQTTGIGTALKILFSFSDDSFSPHSRRDLLKHFEIVSLFNTLARFSESIQAVERFRNIYQARLTAEEEERRRAAADAQIPPMLRDIRDRMLDMRDRLRGWACSAADYIESLHLLLPAFIDPRLMLRKSTRP